MNSIDRMRKNLATKLKERREKIGMSPEAVSLAANISPKVVERIERGEDNYKIDSLLKYAEAVSLNITVDRKV